MAYFALHEDWHFQAAAAYGGITDVGEYLETIDLEGKCASTVWADYATRKNEILQPRSALRWPEKIRKPILIIHGGADETVSPLHSLRMAEALTPAVVDARLKAHSIDAGMPLVVNVPGARHTRASDEHGIIELDGPGTVTLGQKLRLIPGHCDPTVNLHEWFVCIRGDRVEDIWPIAARGAFY